VQSGGDSSLAQILKGYSRLTIESGHAVDCNQLR
jgi:hypothetical protein